MINGLVRLEFDGRFKNWNGFWSLGSIQIPPVTNEWNIYP